MINKMRSLLLVKAIFQDHGRYVLTAFVCSFAISFFFARLSGLPALFFGHNFGCWPSSAQSAARRAGARGVEVAAVGLVSWGCRDGVAGPAIRVRSLGLCHQGKVAGACYEGKVAGLCHEGKVALFLGFTSTALV
jgi:hypothetical protein